MSRTTRIEAIRRYAQSNQDDYFVREVAQHFSEGVRTRSVPIPVYGCSPTAVEKIREIVLEECERHIRDEHERRSSPEGRFIVVYSDESKETIGNGFPGFVVAQERAKDGSVVAITVRDERDGVERRFKTYIYESFEFETYTAIGFSNRDGSMFISEDRRMITCCWRWSG